MQTVLFDGILPPDGAMEAIVASGTLLSDVRTVTAARGLMSREEAEFLLELDRSPKVNGAEWQAFLVHAIADFVVWQSRPTGRVSEADADWLLGVIGDMPTGNGMAIAFAIVREAETVPYRLLEAVMRAGVGRALLV